MILDMIQKPEDLRNIKPELFKKLAREMREEIAQDLLEKGQDPSASLAVVELTLALHLTFDTPQDKIVWDIGHQAAAHKLLTGRRELLARTGRVSLRRDESPYDAFGGGHAATAIAGALGMAFARDQKQAGFKVVAVMGDQTLTAGETFEGLVNAGHLKTDLLVILNDNETFISQRVGVIGKWITKILTFGLVSKVEHRIERFFKRLHLLGLVLLRIARRLRVLLFPGMLFEEMGFSYHGPIDGHDAEGLIEVLRQIKELKGPVLLHVITRKMRVALPENGKMRATGAGSRMFGKALLKAAKQDHRIVAVTAAGVEACGLGEFQKEFPKRLYDTGVSEQHAGTFAAGMATQGLKPILCLQATFLERALDQLIHDIALQHLPVVVIALDCGLSESGPEQSGVFAPSFLRMIPDLSIAAPRNSRELAHMLSAALAQSGPSALLLPSGEMCHFTENGAEPSPAGKAENIAPGTDIALFSWGGMLSACITAREILAQRKISAAVWDARYLKPLDVIAVLGVLEKMPIVVVEESAGIAGLGGAILEVTEDPGKVLCVSLPDEFAGAGDLVSLRSRYGLTPEAIAKSAEEHLHACRSS